MSKGIIGLTISIILVVVTITVVSSRLLYNNSSQTNDAAQCNNPNDYINEEMGFSITLPPNLKTTETTNNQVVFKPDAESPWQISITAEPNGERTTEAWVSSQIQKSINHIKPVAWLKVSEGTNGILFSEPKILDRNDNGPIYGESLYYAYIFEDKLYRLSMRESDHIGTQPIIDEGLINVISSFRPLMRKDLTVLPTEIPDIYR